MNSIRAFPPFRAIMKALSNDSLVYAAVAVGASIYLDTHEYDQIITGAVLAFAGLLIGSSEWSDVQKALSPFRDEIEEVLTELVHNTISVKVDGKAYELDWPDTFKPELMAQMIKALTGSEEPDPPV